MDREAESPSSLLTFSREIAVFDGRHDERRHGNERSTSEALAQASVAAAAAFPSFPLGQSLATHRPSRDPARPMRDAV